MHLRQCPECTTEILEFTESLCFISYLAPLRDLCVVEVTRSACSKGEGIDLAATRPLIWAMSASM